MKSVFHLFFLVFIGFGFMLADSLHTRDELAQLRELNAQLARANAALTVERDSLREGLLESQKIISEGEKTIEELRQALAVSDEHNRQLTLANAALRTTTSVKTALPDARSFLIVLPLIPASIAAGYFMVRANRHAPHGKARAGEDVRLTDDEIREIIRKRRNQI